MQIVKLASVAFVTLGLTSTMACAAFLVPVLSNQISVGSASNEVFVASQAKHKKSGVKTTKKKGHNYNSAPNSSLGYTPGYVPTPYGPGDCIGWWEPLGNGLMRCHGQFIPYRY
jgi:hypothetical protein